MSPACPLDGTGSVPKPGWDGVSRDAPRGGQPGRVQGGWGDRSRAGGKPPWRGRTAAGCPSVSRGKDRALNPLQNNGARAQARKGNRGHCGWLGKASPLETWAAAPGSYLRGLEEVLSLQEMLINHSPGVQRPARTSRGFVAAWEAFCRELPPCPGSSKSLALDAWERLPKGQHREQRKGARK